MRLPIHGFLSSLALILSTSVMLSACSADYEDNKGDGKPADDTGSGDTSDDSGDDTDSGKDTDSGDDTDSGLSDVDGDGDGFSPADGDCDDTDPTVYPGAWEWCDDKDNNCDGISDADADSDGDGTADCEDICPIQVNLAAPVHGDGTFAAPFLTIQEGIDAAPALVCYEVEVHAGTYNENVNFNGINVDLEGIDGSSKTTIDGGGLGSTVSFVSGESVDSHGQARLHGFTITNGTGTGGYGGGVYILTPAGATVATAPVLEENVIIDNSASYGAGVAIVDLAGLTDSPRLSDNTIEQNVAEELGGGIYASSSQAEFEDLEILSNAAWRGAGLYLSGGSPEISRSTVRENVTEAGGGGGGFFLSSSSATLEACTISGNDACYGGVESGCDGGGIRTSGGSPIILGNHVLDNTAGDGGGLWIASGSPVIMQNLIDGNSADDSNEETDDLGFLVKGQGGGVHIHVDTAGTVMLTNNIITNNSASTNGGGLSLNGFYQPWKSEYANSQVQNNVVAFNTCTETDQGAGIVVWGDAAPTLLNNVVYGNDGTGLYTEDVSAIQDEHIVASQVRYNDFYGNSTNVAGYLTTLVGSNGNFSSDPRFTSATDDADPSDDDFTPLSGSPLINTGDPTVLDSDGSRSDVGIYGGTGGSW